MKAKILFSFVLSILLTSLMAQDGEWRNGKFYQSKGLPVYKESLQQLDAVPVRQVSYDIATQTSSLKAIPSKDLRSHNSTAGKLLGDSTMTKRHARAFGSLTAVSNVTEYPYRANVKLFLDFGSVGYVCSGVLIDGMHVLTAAHCIYSHDDGGWATSVEVVPAYDNFSQPYGSAYATYLYSWTGWTVDEDFNWDMGYMSLDRPVGGLVGWYGYGYNTDNSIYTSGTWENSGYPAEAPYDGSEMFTWSGTFDNIQPDLLYHNNLGYGGQSGSGTHQNLSTHSVASHTFLDANGNRIPPFGHCRMTQPRFDQIAADIQSNKVAGGDLTALGTYATPTFVEAGDSLTYLEVIMFNIGQSTFVGDFELTFYLSTDTYIDTSDIDLGTYLWSNGDLDQSESYTAWVTEQYLPTIPSTLSSGTYYIGVVIENTDANLANNFTLSDDVFEIYVVEQVYCFGAQILNDSSGTVEDGSGSNPYNNNSDCEWLMDVVGANSITFDFSEFDIEQDYDFVSFYDGGDISAPLLGNYTGSTLPGSITSSGNQLLLVFTSDVSITQSGWNGYYYADFGPPCDSGDLDLGSGFLDDGQYNTLVDIYSGNTIESFVEVYFNAGGSILLQPEFTIQAGAMFTALTEGCPPD